MSKEYRLEDDLLKKSRPKFGSKRYNRLKAAQWAAGIYGLGRCERCGAALFNPQSVLIHQGGFCQKRIENAPSVTLDQVAELLRNLKQ